MKILDNAIVKDEYDVIIIGAGMGGLTAASLLAKRGVDVLLTEQNFMPGGCCSAVRRGGVTSDVGASMLFGFSDKGLTAHRVVLNHLEMPIDVIPNKSVYRMHWRSKGEKKEITFWRDFDRFFEELTDIFSDSKDELVAFYRYLLKLYKGLFKIPQPISMTEAPLSDGLKQFLLSPLTMTKVIPLVHLSGKSMLKKHFSNPDILAFFDMMVYCINCIPSDTSPALVSLMVFAEMNQGGSYYPVGSPQMLSNVMEKAFEHYGGTTLYRQLVDEILFDTKGKKPKAIGVRLDNGTEIYAKSIISNSNIYNLYGNLIPSRLCKPEKIEAVRNLEYSATVFPIYLSVDKEVIPDTLRPAELFVENMEDLTNLKTVMVFTPSLEDDTLCPEPGVHSMTIVCQADPDHWPRPDDPFYQTEGYQKKKEAEADRILAMMEEHVPNLRKHIRTKLIATPSTVERFLKKHKGNIGGPVQKLGQQMWKREWARTKGYDNLYSCGDSTSGGTGVVTSCSSGIGAANVVLKDQKFGKIFRSQKFKKQYVNFVEEHEKKLSDLIPIDQSIETEEEAKRCARECNWCYQDNCTQKCPASIDVNNFIRRIETGNFKGALRYLKEMNPLSEICGSICPSERFCESECYRKEYADLPVRIKDLQKWVCQYADAEAGPVYEEKRNGLKIAVIGAGPGGLSCAHFLARMGYSVDIFEKRDKPGGMLTHMIPSFRLSEEAIEREFSSLLLPSIKINYGMEFGKDILLKDLTVKYDSIFLAPGLWQGNKLNIKGLEGAEVTDALSFIGSYKKNETMNISDRVLIIGGGSVAADAAAIAKKCGAKNVALVCLESEEEMPALKHEIDEIKKDNVELHCSWGPDTVTDNKLNCKACVSVSDSEGRFSPQFDESAVREIEFDQLIMAVGQRVEVSLKEYLIEEFGTERLQVNSETNLISGKNNVYAGGDIVRGAGTVVQSVADGRRAAAAINKSLS